MASRTSPMRSSMPRGTSSSMDSASNARVGQKQSRGSSVQTQQQQQQQLRTSTTGGIGNVAILWDIENCPVPGEVNTEDVAGNIRYALRDHPQIGAVTMFSAYGDFNHFPRKVREGCQRTGVNLIEVPDGKKNAADKAILVDMLLFALENRPPSTIFLITGDVDFAPALHKLGQRGYMVVLVVPDGVGVSSALCAAGNYVWDWPSLCRGYLIYPQKYVQNRVVNNAHEFEDRNSVNGSFQNAYSEPVPRHWGDEEHDPQNEDLAFGEEIFMWQPLLNVYPVDSGVSYPRRQSTENFSQAQFGTTHAQSQQVPRLVQKSSCLHHIPVPAPPSSKGQSRPLFPNPEPAGQIGMLPGEVGTVGDATSQPTSPGGVSQTIWVMPPRDMSGLKRQFVKLLSLNGGKMALVRVPVEYNKQFGRPLYLADYNASKLVNLIEKMKDSLCIKGEGGQKILHLRKSSLRASHKYRTSSNRASVPKSEKEKDVSDDSEAEGQGPIVKEVEKETSRVEKVTSQDVPSKQFPLDSDTGYTGVQASVVLDWDSGDEKANNGEEVEEVMKDPEAQNRGSGFVGPLGVPNKWDCQSSSQEEGFQSTYQKEVSANLESDTSEGKNRNNEIHQFSQHGEGLGTYLDQVGHFVVPENGNFDEENLQKSLQHMLIGLQRHGEVAVTNLYQFHAEYMGDSIFDATREVVEGVEFLFSDAQCMSRMVGVGLERAKVLVTSGYEVEVMQLSENNWKRCWEKVFSQVKDSESFELVAIKMPKLQGDHVKSTSLPAEDISRKFGVSLKDFPETHVITLNCEEEQSAQFFPLVWKVVDEYRNLKCGSTCATTKQTSGTGSTKSPNTSSSGSIQQSTSGGGPNFSQSPSLTRQEEKMDDDEDDDKSLPPEDPLPPDPSSAPNDMRNRKLKVSIFPGAGGAFHDPDTKQRVQQTPFRQVATIMPVIEIEFLQEGIDKKFRTVTTKTQCNLGTDDGPKCRGVNFYSWYQNNIKISFKGNDQQTQLLSSSTSAQDDSLIETKLTINKALMASTSSSQEESRGAGGQIRIAGSGVQGQIDIKATETQGGNLTIANTQEIGGIKQIQGFIVHPRCQENDLIFNFFLPSRLIHGSSTQSGIDLQSLSQCDDTFEPKVTGKWIVWSEDQHACYVFKVRRYLYRLPLSELHQDEIKCLLQDYKLLMFVNLAMTHLDRYNTNDIVRLTERNPELPYVIKVTPGG